MSLKHATLASALLSLAAATPQWGNPNGNGGGSWGQGGPFAAFPSCASSCRPSNIDYGNPGALCSDSSTLDSLSSCVDSSSCDDSDKNDIRETIAQLCVNAGASITQAPFATYSVTSGKSAATDGRWSGISGYPTASSEWASWASANGLPTAAAWSELSSWTSAWPTAASEWSSFTSAHPLPSDIASWASANGFPGGSAWPTAWTTNSAWASAISDWSGSGGPSGYHGGPGGPFGHGWGSGPWSSGAWASGPWTAWWDGSACPPSSWTGWTAGTWSENAPWTSWTACTATATASTVYEITTTNSVGSQITEASTSFAYRVEAATNSVASTTTDSGSMPTNAAFIGSAAGVLGVLAGAILL